MKFADTMSDTTIENMLHSVCSGDFSPANNPNITRILYLHGTQGNEVYSRKTAKRMKKYYPELIIKCFDGYKRAELAVYEPANFIQDTMIDLLLGHCRIFHLEEECSNQ